MRQGDGIVPALRNAYRNPYLLNFASGFLLSAGGIPCLSFSFSILLGQLLLAGMRTELGGAR
jgi:hypothetical protein